MGSFLELLSQNDTLWKFVELSKLWKSLLFLVIILNYKNLPLVFHVQTPNSQFHGYT